MSESELRAAYWQARTRVFEVGQLARRTNPRTPAGRRIDRLWSAATRNFDLICAVGAKRGIRFTAAT